MNRDERDGADERTDEDRRRQPVTVLDPGVEVSGRDPIAETEGQSGQPSPESVARTGAADGDQDEGGDGDGHRQLGESGHVGVPLAAPPGVAPGAGEPSGASP